MLTRERRLVTKLIAQLARARMILSRQLVSSYEGDSPDVVSVVLEFAWLQRPARPAQLPQPRRAGTEVDDHRDEAREGASRRGRAAAGKARGGRDPGDRGGDEQRAGAGRHEHPAAGQAGGARAGPRGPAIGARREPREGRPAAIGYRATPGATGGRRARRGRSRGVAPVTTHRRRRVRRRRSQRARARPVGRLGDPVCDRALRVGRTEPLTQQRGRLGLLPDPPEHLEAVRWNGAGCVPGQQGRAGRRRLTNLERRRRSLQLGLRRHRRHSLTPPQAQLVEPRWFDGWVPMRSPPDTSPGGAVADRNLPRAAGLFFTMRRSLRLLGAVLCTLSALASLAAAASAASSVSVFPSPGTRYAEPGTQITFRGISAGRIGSISVVGSRSGAHSGHVAADSDGNGGSFLPNHPFDAGETVTVATGLNVVDGNRGVVAVHRGHAGRRDQGDPGRTRARRGTRRPALPLAARPAALVSRGAQARRLAGERRHLRRASVRTKPGRSDAARHLREPDLVPPGAERASSRPTSARRRWETSRCLRGGRAT